MAALPWDRFASLLQDADTAVQVGRALQHILGLTLRLSVKWSNAGES